jgi:acyl-CoA thioesterase-1
MKNLVVVLLVLLPSLVFAGPPRVLILGDSLTEGLGVSKEQAYPALLETSLKKRFPQITVVNAGISGSTSASAESRLKWQLKNKPDLLVLALGANDGLRGLPVEAMKSNLEKTIKLAQENKIRVILAGMKIPMNYGEPYRKSYEKVFSDLAKKYSLPFVPFLLEGVGGNPAMNIADGIHPNPEGHKKIAATLTPYIEIALKGH